MLLWLGIIQIQHLPKLLDWVLKVIERCLAIAIAWSAFYFGYRLAVGSSIPAQNTLVLNLGKHWQTALLLLLPLFYLTVRTFLEEVQEAFGMKRQQLPGAQEPVEDVSVSNARHVAPTAKTSG